MTKWKLIKETENFIIEYDESTAKYRVSCFEDNHFVDDCEFDAPIKCGEWKPVLVRYGSRSEVYVPREKCSVCGCNQQFQSKYCPNCGAKMDGGSNNE